MNGESVPDLDAFLQCVRKLVDRASVRLKTIDLNTKCKVRCGVVWCTCPLLLKSYDTDFLFFQVFTLKTDYQYWPTVELVRKEDQWQLHTVGDGEE